MRVTSQAIGIATCLAAALLAPGGRAPEVAPPAGARAAAIEPEAARRMVRIAGCRGRAIPDQKSVSNLVCGPTAALISLAFGTEKARRAYAARPGKTDAARIRAVIAGPGKAPSRDYGDGSRMRARGMSAVDLLDLVNDLREAADLEPARGTYLSRRESETTPRHLRGVHARLVESLKASEPVILHIRSFYAGRRSEGAEIQWNGLLSHFVVAIGVPAELAPGAEGFAVEYLDPAGGKPGELYLAAETTRNFTASEGNRTRWVWRKNFPFLRVHAPTLRLNRQQRPWHERTIAVLHHMIGAWK